MPNQLGYGLLVEPLGIGPDQLGYGPRVGYVVTDARRAMALRSHLDHGMFFPPFRT